MLHEAMSHQQIFLVDVAAVPVVFSRLSLINLIQDSKKKVLVWLSLHKALSYRSLLLLPLFFYV